MAVNTLVTGMIVFRILKVTAGVKPTSIERSLGSTGGSNFRHIMFVIIESGMALFVIQLIRVVLEMLVVYPVRTMPVKDFFIIATVEDIVIAINQMLNVIIIIISVRFYFADSICLARASHQR